MQEGKERQRIYAEEKVKEAEESNRKDLLILNYFDTKPCLGPLDNIYQIPIIYPTPYPMGFKGQIAGAVYSRMRPNERFKVNVNGVFTLIETGSKYLKEFLNYHYDFYKGDKNEFVTQLEDCIILGETVFGELNQYSQLKDVFDRTINEKKLNSVIAQQVKINEGVANNKNQSKSKRLGAKYYALLHKIKISLGDRKRF